MYTEQNPNGKGKRSPVITILIISLVLGGAVFFLNRVITASAYFTDYTLTQNTYPNIVGSRIDSCSLCHTSAPALNNYGKAYKNLGRYNAASLTMIEALDSDGDGYTNIQELTALTFPGDAADFPQIPTNTPTTVPPTATPTNTAVPPTNTAVPPTNTAVPPTNTSVPPTATNTSVAPTATNPGYPPPATAVPPTATSVAPTITVAAPTATNTSMPATATETPIVVPPVGATMQPTETEEVEETEEPEATEKPEKTKKPEATEKPEKTQAAVTKTPKATKVYPTRIPTMVCVKDDDSLKRSSSSTTGSAPDGRSEIRCPRGYHVLGTQNGDYAKFNLKPSFSIYSRRIR